jgi:hypothetical protein
MRVSLLAKIFLAIGLPWVQQEKLKIGRYGDIIRTDTHRLKKRAKSISSEDSRFISRKSKKLSYINREFYPLQNECLDTNLNQDYFITIYYSFSTEIAGRIQCSQLFTPLECPSVLSPATEPFEEDGRQCYSQRLDQKPSSYAKRFTA